MEHNDKELPPASGVPGFGEKQFHLLVICYEPNYFPLVTLNLLIITILLWVIREIRRDIKCEALSTIPEI